MEPSKGLVEWTRTKLLLDREAPQVFDELLIQKFKKMDHTIHDKKMQSNFGEVYSVEKREKEIPLFFWEWRKVNFRTQFCYICIDQLVMYIHSYQIQGTLSHFHFKLGIYKRRNPHQHITCNSQQPCIPNYLKKPQANQLEILSLI